MATTENLKEAFAGESQANRRYTAFARKADEEGRKQIARLFRAAAEAETVHALAHLRVLGGVKDTSENLKAAVGGEHYEFTKMYPQFVNEGQEEDNKAAVRSFKLAMQVEEIHHGLYESALKSLEGGSDLPEQQIFVCGVCGNTVLGEAPEKCPVCGAPRVKFLEVK